MFDFLIKKLYPYSNTIKRKWIVTSMKILLFYGVVPSLNYFSDELSRVFRSMGIETSFLDLNDSNADFNIFVRERFDAALCYNCIGTFTMGNSELAGIYDALNIPVINVLMDHPMNLSYCMERHPAKYIQFSPDEEHVKYAKKYYDIDNCFFLPHMASPGSNAVIEKDIQILFPAALYQPDGVYKRILDTFQNNPFILDIVKNLLEFLIANTRYTIEGALEKCLCDMGLELSLRQFAALMSGTKDVDLFIRMYYREKAVSEIAKTGRPIVIVGNGWQESEIAKLSNILVMPSTSFEGVFSYMDRSQVTLTVMPWFKAGTHDRIFNSLLHNSCPLADESRWLLNHLSPDLECAYFSLDALENAGDIIEKLFADSDIRNRIVENGKKKVRDNYTSHNIARQILSYLEECYGIRA